MLRWVKRTLRWAALIGVTVAALIVAAAFLIQTLLSGFLQDYVQKDLGWALKIGSAQIEFHPLTIRLERIEIAADQKTFFQAKSVFVSLPYSSLWKENFTIHQLLLQYPVVDLDLFPSRAAPSKPGTQKARLFQIDQATIHQGEIQFRKQRFREINVQSTINSEGIGVWKLDSIFHDVTLTAKGGLKNWTNPEVDFQYTVQGESADLAPLLEREPEWKGPIVARGSVKGKWQHLVTKGQADCANFSIRNSDPFSFSARYQYEAANESKPISIAITFASVPVELIRNYSRSIPQFTSTGSGTLVYSGGTDFWNGTGKFGIVLQPTKTASFPLSGRINGRLQKGFVQLDPSSLLLSNSQLVFNGALSQDRLAIDAHFQSSNLNDLAFVSKKFSSVPGIYRVHAQLAGPYKNIGVSAELSGRSGNSVVEAKGNTSLGTESLSIEFHGIAHAKELQKYIADIHAGQLQVEGMIRGTWNNPLINASLNGGDLQIREIKLKELSAKVEMDARSLQFHADVPEFQFRAEGVYQLRSGAYEIRGASDGVGLEQIFAQADAKQSVVHGLVQVNFEAAGNIYRWKESVATFHLQSQQIQWKDLIVSVPEAQVNVEKRIAHVNALAESPNAHVQLTGTASLLSRTPLDLRMLGNVNGAALEKISSDWKGKGKLDFDAVIAGTAAHPKIEASLRTENFNAEYLPKNWSVSLQQMEVKLAERHLNVEGNGKVNDSSFFCKGVIPLEREDGNLHFEFTGLPVSMLAPEQNVSGTLNITADLEGKGFPLKEWETGQTVRLPFQDWIGKISVQTSDLKYGANLLVVAEPILVTIQNHQVSLSPTRISSGDLLNFLASGNLNLTTGKLAGKVRLESKLELLSSLKPDIQSSGPLGADLQFSGTLKNPEFSGIISLTNASLRIPDSPITLEGLDLLASVNNRSLRIEKLQGRSGGGVITGGGELIFGTRTSQVWFQGKNVAANYPEGLRSQVDFDLKLSSLESGALLSGDIRVLRSLYEQQLTLKNPILRKLLASTTELTAQKQFKNQIKLDLSIRTVRDLRLKNNLAIVRAGGDLKLQGTLYKPRLGGRIDIRQGSRMFLVGNQYDVEKARIDFFGSDVIEPNFDITISTLLRDFQTDNYYEVVLPFGGSASSIEFKNVRSTPSLSQDQIFSLLTQGTVEAEQSTSGRSVFQRQILTFLAGQALSAPSAAIAKTIGLSRIQVQQEGLSSVNDPQTRLMLGKDIGAGFSLIYSFVLNDPQEQTWIATYRYGRNIIGRFIDQDDNTYTMSVSHRIQFGKGVSQRSFSRSGRKRARAPKVASVDWTNDSPLTEKQIRNILKTDSGDDYDYWTLQDRVDELKQELQKLDYLYPSVDVREKEAETAVVSLAIEIHAGDKSEMVFRGYQVGGKLLDRYKQMWRTGISAIVVQQMIQDDLLRQIQLSGYYKASVNSGVEKTNAKTTYYFETNPGPRYTSVELAFQGTHQYDPKALQTDLLQLYPSSAMMFREAIRKPEDFTDKIKALYVQQGYLRTDITMGATQYSNAGKIVQPIQIHEGPLSSIDAVLTADGKAIPDPLQTQVQLAKGKTFRPDALLEDEITIQDFYESQGHQNVSVSYNIEFTKGTSNLQLRWGIDAGSIARIASIRVEGNQTTRADLILKQAGLKEGDVLTQRNQSFARKRLSNLGVFQQIDLESEETDVPGQYAVVIHVSESKRYEFQYGGRYNTDDKLGAEVRLSDFNFLGRAQNLSLYVRTTLDAPLFRLDYTLPETGSFWDRARFSIFRDETDEDVRATVSGKLIKHAFTKKQLSFQFQQDRKLWSIYRLLWGLEFGSLSADFEDPEVFPPGHFQGAEGVLRATFLADRRDDPLNATRGYFYSIDGEFAPKIPGTDVEYRKNFDQVFYYMSIGKIVLAGGLRVGFLSVRTDNEITDAKKFRTGGSNTVRGFAHNTIVPPSEDPTDLTNIFFGGDSVLILNEEFRFPIYKWFSGATFFDAGNVYNLVSDFDPTDLRYSAGVGIRAGAAGFILRFDLGFNLDRRDNEAPHVFHFGIGQAF